MLGISDKWKQRLKEMISGAPVAPFIEVGDVYDFGKEIYKDYIYDREKKEVLPSGLISYNVQQKKAVPKHGELAKLATTNIGELTPDEQEKKIQQDLDLATSTMPIVGVGKFGSKVANKIASKEIGAVKKTGQKIGEAVSDVVKKTAKKFSDILDNVEATKPAEISKVEPTPTRVQPKVPISQKALSNEARKYKSAEEFVKAQFGRDVKFAKVDSLDVYETNINRGLVEDIKKQIQNGDFVGALQHREAIGKTPAIRVEDGKVIDGNHRLIALKELGIKEAPVEIIGSSGKVDLTTKSQLTDIWNKAQTKTDPLIQEAKKYKSAEEFIKAQGTPVYHGTYEKGAIKFDKSKLGVNKPDFLSNLGFHFTPDKKMADNLFAYDYGGKGQGQTIEAVLNIKKPLKITETDLVKDIIRYGKEKGTIPKPTADELLKRPLWGKTTDIKDITHYIYRVSKQSPEKARFNIKQVAQDYLENLKKQGYDGIQYKNEIEWAADNRYDFIAFEPSQIKTKSQLTDIWNKAQTKTDPLIQEAKKYKSAEEFIKAQGTPVYHGGAGVDELSKSVKILSPEDKLKYPSSGGGYIGLSTSPDKSYAQQYSRQIAGRDDVAELFIQPNAKIKNIKGAIDDMSADELEKLSKKFDVLKSVEDNEFRILNENIIKTKSQLTDIWKESQPLSTNKGTQTLTEALRGEAKGGYKAKTSGADDYYRLVKRDEADDIMKNGLKPNADGYVNLATPGGISRIARLSSVKGDNVLIKVRPKNIDSVTSDSAAVRGKISPKRISLISDLRKETLEKKLKDLLNI